MCGRVVWWYHLLKLPRSSITKSFFSCLKLCQTLFGLKFCTLGICIRLNLSGKFQSKWLFPRTKLGEDTSFCLYQTILVTFCVCVWYFNDWKQKHKIWQGWWRCPACALCCSCFYFSRQKILKNLRLQMLSRGFLDFWSHSSERPLSVLIEISACSDLDFFVVVTVWYHKYIQQDLSTLNSWSLCFGPLFILLMLYFSVQWINECCGFQC